MGCGATKPAEEKSAARTIYVVPVKPPPSPTQRTDQELDVEKLRQKISSTVWHRLLAAAGVKADTARLPTVGVALSGGGWRALTGASGFIEGLRQCGMLDGVTFVCGASGGAWLTYLWMTSTPAHNQLLKPTPAAATNQQHLPGPAAAATATIVHETNPWIASTASPQQHHGNAPVSFDGLVHMRDARHVSSSAKFNDKTSDGIVSTVMLQAAGPIAIIPAVLESQQLGSTPLERWANFLRGDLLDQNDHASVPTATGHLVDGTSPILLASLLGTNPKPASQSLADQYTWMEVSPFGLRRLAPHALPTVPNSEVRFKVIGAADQRAFNPKLSHFMAATSSWFAIDPEAALEMATPTVANFFGNTVGSLSTQSVLSGSEVHITSESGVDFGPAKDCGEAINVPLVQLLQHTSGRQVDIILCLDNSMMVNCQHAQSMSRAVSYGILKPGDYEDAEFDASIGEAEHHFRVFRPKRPGLPVVIYCMGLNTTSTLRICATSAEVNAQAREVCDRTVRWFGPALMGAVRDFVQHSPAR